MVGYAKAEAPPAVSCVTDAEALNKEWQWTWPKPPSPKPRSTEIIEDRRGHRYTVSEYESMYLRLNQSWKLCQDGNLVEARNKMFIVRSWLNAANGQSTDE